MSAERIDVAAAFLCDGVDIEGTVERVLFAEKYALGYEPDTAMLVVAKRGSKSVYVIPWANVKGMKLVRSGAESSESAVAAGPRRVPRGPGAKPAP